MGISSPDDINAVLVEEVNTCMRDTNGATYERVERIAMITVLKNMQIKCN
jgi:hypothetical protein